MKNSRALRAGVLAVASLALLPVLAAAQAISDSTFTDANWTLTQFPGGGGGSVVAGQASSGGNFYRTVADQVNASGLILSTHIYNPFTYDPSVSGSIGAVSYSEDVFCVAGCFGQGQSTGPALTQGGVTYVFNGFLITGPSGTAHPITANGLTAANFARVAVTATTFFDNSQHPDFSAAGAPIQFGFLRANSAGAGGGYTLTAASDNFQLNITPGTAAVAAVPTLNPLAMGALALMLGIAGLLFLRRS